MKVFAILLTMIVAMNIILEIIKKPSANKWGAVLGILFVFSIVLSLATQTPFSKSKSVKSTSNYVSHNYVNTSNSYSGTKSSKSIGNYKSALTKEEAAALNGTGFHGTRPNSLAESMELQAAQVKCKKCGYHSDNGVNSLCDYCQSRR